MTRKEAIRINHQEDTLVALGFTRQEAETLRLISKTLSRWGERECNGEVQRDGEKGDGAPWVHSTYDGRRLYKTADKERGALKRLAAIFARPALRHSVTFYHQTDPRGAALYVLRPGDVPEGEDAGSYYSRGIAVY